MPRFESGGRSYPAGSAGGRTTGGKTGSSTGTGSEAEARYAARRERIERLMVALDLDTPATEDLLGHSDYRHKPMRWVVETESAKGFGHFLTGAGTRKHAEQVAGENVGE